MKINQRISIEILCLTVCVFLLGCNPFTSKSQSSLLEYLGYIPNQAEYREFTVYGDMQAWYNAWGIPRPETSTQVNESENQSELIVVLPTQTTPPQMFFMGQTSGDQIDYYGFNVFSIDQHLQAGLGKSTITLVDLQDNKLVEPALQAYGYTSNSLSSGELYSYGEDNAMHPDAPNSAGRLSFFNRIYIKGDRLIIATATDVVESALDAASGKISSLADDKVFQAAAAALADPALKDLGQLVGVLLLELDQLEKDPDFDLAAFATFQADENTTYLALLLVLPAGQDADAAAALVSEKMSNYVSTLSGPLNERGEFQRAYGTKEEGLPVAVVVMKANVVRSYHEDLDMNMVVVLDWFRLVTRYDLGFLEALP